MESHSKSTYFIKPSTHQIFITSISVAKLQATLKSLYIKPFTLIVTVKIQISSFPQKMVKSLFNHSYQISTAKFMRKYNSPQNPYALIFLPNILIILNHLSTHGVSFQIPLISSLNQKSPEKNIISTQIHYSYKRIKRGNILSTSNAK